MTHNELLCAKISHALNVHVLKCRLCCYAACTEITVLKSSESLAPVAPLLLFLFAYYNSMTGIDYTILYHIFIKNNRVSTIFVSERKCLKQILELVT